jgi:hypothetical protein
MDKLTGRRRIARGDRFFETIEHICIFADLMLMGAAMDKKVIIETFDLSGNNAIIGAQHIPLQIKIPCQAPLGGALRSIAADYYFMTVEPTNPPSLLHNMESQHQNFVDLFQWFFNGVFVSFYEYHKPQMQKKFGRETKDWPDFFRFCWAMRNAAAHHRGYINFENLKSKPVSWRGLTYGPDDNLKKPVMGGAFNAGDVFLLTLELSEELDRLGVPL